MIALTISGEFLEQFEQSLDPTHLERSKIPVKVLGYGEISTVLSIRTDREFETEKGFACKRMPLFSNRASAEVYTDHYREYCQLLLQAGLTLPEDRTEIIEPSNRPVVFYILQKQLPPDRFCHKLIHTLEVDAIKGVIRRVVTEISKVWQFNRENEPKKRLAIDGQLSNWVLVGDVETGELYYVDTSTPLYQVDNEEQLDPELFLQSAPSFLRWIIRWLFLEDVMTRYYDERQVFIDLAANLYKEQCPDLVPLAVEIINPALNSKVEPLSVEEVEKYYKEDKIIWALFLSFRKIDRWIKTKLLRRRYEFILPGKIKR